MLIGKPQEIPHSAVTPKSIYVTHSMGDWILRFLLITLAVTPVRSLLEMPSLIRFRRMFGLFAFFYGCLHFLTYIWFDKFFNLEEIGKDVGKRPFTTIGFISLLLMVPLAATSTAASIRHLEEGAGSCCIDSCIW